ncbi:MAG: efflux RND transporter permease subunit [Alphaproteobacteria bacterium]
MNAIIDYAIHRSRTILSIMVVTLVAGFAAYVGIPKESDPDIDFPIIYISIPYPGISPEDAERLLVKPMELRLKTIQGLKDYNATAAEGFANIILQFEPSFDKEKALQDVRQQVDMAKADLPVDAKQPNIVEFNTSQQPVVTVNLSGDVPERTMVHIAKDLRDKIKAVPSVLDADIAGLRDELLEVVIDPVRLASYQVSESELFNAVTRNNQLVPAGNLDTGHGRFSIKVPGLFENREDVLGIPVKVKGDTVVTLGQVADIRRTFWDRTSFARLNGKPGISINVTKRSGGNIINTVKAVRAAVAQAEAVYPQTLNITYSGDASRWIYTQIGSLESALITAIVLVMIVVVASLGLRSAALVGITVPTSFFLAFLFLYAFGYTMNFMVMFGLLLAVGILVDGGIIVVEYADRKMTEGVPKKDAYAQAAKRMFWPVVSSTATAIACFLPMLFWPGIAGKFMMYLPITLILTLSSSLVSALIFLPVLGSIFGKASAEDPETLKAIEASETGDLDKIPGITGTYARVLQKLVHHPIRVMLGTLASLVLIVVAFIFFNNGFEFFVTEEPDFIYVMVEARGNLSADEVRDLVIGVEDRLHGLPGVDSMNTQTVSSRGSGVSIGNGGGNTTDTVGTILLELKDSKLRPKAAQIMEMVRARTKDMPGIVVELRKVDNGVGGGKDVQIELRADENEPLFAAAGLIRKHMDQDPQLRDVEDSRPLPGIEWNFEVNREAAARYGADIATVGAWVQLVTNGLLVGRYRPTDAEDEVDIRVRFPFADRGLSQFDELQLQTPNGLVPITNFVKRTPKPLVDQINRVDGKRVIAVKANAAPGVNAFAKTQQIKAWVAKQNIDPSVTVKFRGSNEGQQESSAFLMWAFLAAMFLMGIILVTQFNSFYHSALILSAVILSTVGVFLGIMLSGQTFSVIMTGTGIVALAGVVVNHNIVLIDTYQRLREQGLEAYEAVVRTAVQRLRPVYLTSVVTMLGLLPLAFQLDINFFTRTIEYGNASSGMWVPLATAVVWGLAFSSILTLVVTPCLLALPARLGRTKAIKPRKPSRIGKFVRHVLGEDKADDVAVPGPVPGHAEAAE